MLEGVLEELEGQREREKLGRGKMKNLFAIVLNPQNPSVNKPSSSL